MPPPPRALTIAAATGNDAALQAAFDADPSHLSELDPAIGGSALHVAAAKDRRGAVAWLLAKGADATVADAEGATPLMRATEDRLWGVCGQLAATVDSALATARGPGGPPALHNALLVGDKATALFLLREVGASAAATDAEGASALHCAATSGLLDDDDELARALLGGGGGAALDAADSAGATPLICAVLAGREGTVKGLLAAGASRAATDLSGQTAAEHAAEGAFDATGKRILALFD